MKCNPNKKMALPGSRWPSGSRKKEENNEVCLSQQKNAQSAYIASKMKIFLVWMVNKTAIRLWIEG